MNKSNQDDNTSNKNSEFDIFGIIAKKPNKSAGNKSQGDDDLVDLMGVPTPTNSDLHRSKSTNNTN